MPAASSSGPLGRVANTKGSFRGKASRRSNRGSGSADRSLGCLIDDTWRLSWLSLPILAHRLECKGSSHCIV
ncbi:hypothetical protein D3C78_1860420 [compost metagenome]